MKSIKALLFSVLGGIILTSCFNNPKFSDEEALEKLVKRVDLKEEIVNVAKNSIIDNNIYVWNLWDPVHYKDSINWDIDPYKNRSWYLYFQSLRMVGFLAEDYKYSRDSINEIKSYEIVKSWYDKYNKDFIVEDNSKLPKNVWNDHASANRVLNLTHAYFTFTGNEKFRSLIKETLYYHGLWLANKKNYTQGNHAIMMDRALLQLSQLFDFPESSRWQETSVNRTKKIFEKEITAEGVCTENSAGYHFYVLDLLLDSVELFDSYGLEPIDEWSEKVKKMKLFGESMLTSDNRIPTIGDTYYSKYPINLFYKYNDSSLLYNSTYTVKGNRNALKSKVYAKSGYAFLKEKIAKPDSSTYINRTYLSFINTNLSPVHEHNDFLSFTLSSNNEDLIIDAGHISYEKNDMTNYIRSTFAHSTLTIDNESFNFKKIKPEQIEIVDYEVSEDFSYIKGTFTIDESYKIERTIVLLNPNQVVLYDHLIAKKDYKSFSQIFNLGNNFNSLKQENDKKVILSFNKNNLIIEQMENSKKINYKLLLSDYNNNELKGIRANGYGKVKDGSILKYNYHVDINHKVLNFSYLTLLTIENKRFLNTPMKVNNKKEVIEIVKNNKVIKLINK